MPERVINFIRSYQVRYDECNFFGFLTPAATVRFLQDIAVRHYSSANLNNGGDWITRRTVLDFHSSIPAYASLDLETFVGGTSKVTSQRKYELRQENGTPVVTGYTLWVYLGANGRPTRVPANFLEYFWPGGTTPMPEGAEWPAWPERPPALYRHRVHFSDLDIQAHMNNAAYLDLLDNAGWEAEPAGAPEGKVLIPLHYDLEYLDYALLGHELEVQTWLEPWPDGTFERLQQISREGRPVAKARSQWEWK
jgi:acyl-CoA thioesterase FadM